MGMIKDNVVQGLVFLVIFYLKEDVVEVIVVPSIGYDTRQIRVTTRFKREVVKGVVLIMVVVCDIIQGREIVNLLINIIPDINMVQVKAFSVESPQGVVHQEVDLRYVRGRTVRDLVLKLVVSYLIKESIVHYCTMI